MKTSTVEVNMLPNNTPETPGLQAQLTRLRSRKRALDEIIGSLERYLVEELAETSYRQGRTLTLTDDAASDSKGCRITIAVTNGKRLRRRWCRAHAI